MKLSAEVDATVRPQGSLVEVLGLGDEVEGDGRQQRPRAEAGENADKGARDSHPADEQPRDVAALWTRAG